MKKEKRQNLKDSKVYLIGSGIAGLVTLTDSNWLMSIVIARQPHFPNQPDDVKIFWGYGLYPDRKANCIPVAMPFIDSLFMPSNIGDRPDVIPKGATNFTFLGQFTEAPKDCVFTIEYSVRTAQMAVYGLFDTGKEVHPMYDSAHNPKYLLGAYKAISR